MGDSGMNFEADVWQNIWGDEGEVSTISNFWVGDLESDQEVVGCFWGDRILWGLLYWGLDLYSIHSRASF